MKRWCGFAAMLALLCLAASAASAQSLDIRMVRATDVGPSNPNPAGLGDVVGVLGKSLPYRNFSLVGSGSLMLPSNGSTSVGGYSISCNGPASGLAITVRRGARVVLNTTVRLAAGRPLIVGGFPDDEGKLVLVFVLR